MAKVFKLKGEKSPFYYYRVRVLEKGKKKDKWKSTGETDQKKAQAVANGHRAATTGAMNTDELFHMLIAKLDTLPEDERQSKRIDYGQRLIRLQCHLGA